MTAVSQNFTTYSGDDALPIFTVVDGSNVAIDISTVADIIFTARRTASAAIALQKKKTTGGVAFTNSGADGKFQVTITAANTALLSGNYVFQAQIIDSLNKTTTVALGTMSIGVPPTWTFDTTLLSGTDATAKLMQVRTLIGDTLVSDQLLYDEQISMAIAQRPNIYGAAADSCRYIAAKMARKVDTIQPGPLSVMYSSQSKNYEMRAIALDKMASMRGGGMPYAGGISVIDKLTQVLDTDRVAPQFNIGMQDSFTPVSPAGNVIPGSNSSDVEGSF